MPDANDPTGRAAARSKAVAALKPTIDVIIDRHYNSKVYTSGSVIAGRAIIKTVRDIAFDHFDIVFTGIAATRLDFVQQYPSHSFRPFLKMRMPISEEDVPEDRVFRAAHTYTIPFHFVVPHQLPMGACKHQCEVGPVLDHHLRLPPTIGFWGADDQAPEMAQIEYAVKARAVKQQLGGVPASKVMEGQHVVKVLPASPEDAPLDITFRDERYTMAKTKTIRKNLFSAKTGKLTATSIQPEAVMFSADGRNASTSTAHIDLEFVPDSVDTAPPKINSISAKLLSTTFFGAAPVNYMPNLGPRTAYHGNPCLNYTTTNNILNMPVEKVSWLQEKVEAGRRDSGYSSSHLSPDSDAMTKGNGNKKAASPIKHVATLDVPFTVTNTNRKIFLPTFHSCLISRTYVLQLCLSVGPTNTTMTLSVPVQVGVETIHDDPQGGELPSFETVMARDEEAEADTYLRPRIRRAASDDAPQTNTLLPGYSELSRRAVVPVAPVA
ncbi:arrestin [Cordyceps fumosorosea ARSEF 2679]|uniref:Arrestin n=1 Tax=Cordyceps fumosorosea (strain ARSEF 2679) TaxID=1081104 RepID=A0A168AJG2_CORFA|nr:arrestin [Cordyceps fumosorosea ARSEF 2679]OAA68831.1 arrestin [Cordyceps fumosorosea ARSEF 2679]